MIGLLTIVFRNGSNYVYHFTIKELVEELEGQFHCLGENTEKYMFSVPIEMEKKLPRPHTTDYSLLIAQDLW